MESNLRDSSVQPKIHRLRVVTARLKALLLDATKKNFWVRAQLVSNKGNRQGGHFYGELVDIDDNGQTLAKMRVVIWRAEYQKIRQKLLDDGQPDALEGNREICAYCAVRFHEVYGLQLQVFDVDPTFGESHIDRNRRQILEKLQREGLLDKNKTTELVAAPLRIGLITSANSAACADFTKTLGASPFSFKTLLVPAAMQGQATANEVVAAIGTLVASRVEVICLVRGGGSPMDLAWFDDEAIGRAIANCPVPVWVGIGHEIDLTVPDFVAHTPHKTPTAVAEALVERIRVLDNDLALFRDRLLEVFSRRMELADRSIVQNRNGLQQGTRKHLEIQNERFLGHVLKLESALDAMVAGRARRLSECVIQLKERVRGEIGSGEQSLGNTTSRFEDGLTRRLQRAHEAGLRGVNGLVEGIRKHLAWNEERFRRRAVTLRGAIDKAFDSRAGLLATMCILLEERSRGGQADGQRELDRRKHELLAAVDRIVDGRQKILDLKTSRFGFAQYQQSLERASRHLDEKGKRLIALSPERHLARGYSITRDGQGRVIRDARETQVGEPIHTQLAEGFLTSTVVHKENEDG